MAETFDGEGQEPEQGFKTDTETLQDARHEFAEAAIWRKEEEGFKAKTKDAKERAEAFEAAGIEIVMRKNSAQLGLGLTSVVAGAPDIEPPCASASGHDWQTIRIQDGMILQDCDRCPAERTSQESENPTELPVWIYTRRETPAGVDA